MDHQDRLFRFTWPHLSSTTLRSSGVYLSGLFYALGFYALLDSALFSKSVQNGSIVHVGFPDWIPFLVSSLGMFIINIVDKARLQAAGGGDGFSFAGSAGDADWQAKVVLFLGFASLAGGLAGSIVILVIKYIVKGFPMPTLGMGILNVVANGAVMISTILLWLAQNLEDEYSYNLQL